MRFHDFDRNGRADGRDFYLLNELLKEEEEREEDRGLYGESGDEDGGDDL